MPFQRVLRRFKSSPSIRTLSIEPPKPASTPTFPHCVPSISLFLKRDNPLLTDSRYIREVDDLINLIDLMLEDSL
jgi:hypothetical protein